MIDLSGLFEPGPKTRHFNNLKEELGAISSGEKAMSVFFFPRSAAETDHLKAIVAAALDLGLAVIYHVERWPVENSLYEELYVFVLSKNQSWRIPSYMVTRRILREYRWSDGAEHLESFLLGYGEEDIKAWIAHKRNIRASWTGLTVYLLMPENQFRCIRDLGMRCLDPNSLCEEVTAFFSRSNLALRRDWRALVPKGTVITRAAVKHAFFERLFGEAQSWGPAEIVSSAITKELARLLNPALESNFQILDHDGWH
jgi:hypothetical protein